MDTEAAATNYHAYLVRLWRDSLHAPWRAAVTHVATGAVHRFASPELAWTYVQEQLQAQPDATARVGAGQPAESGWHYSKE